MRHATFAELKELLTSDPTKLLLEIGKPDAQLSIPVDGQGLRILVEVEAGQSKKVPASVFVRIGDEDLELHLEVRETAQDYRPLVRMK